MARKPDPQIDGAAAETGPGEMAPGVPLDDFPPYLLNRIVNRINTNLGEALKAIGASVQQYRVLAVLIAGDRRSVNELAVYTVTEQSTLSKILDRMAAQGLVERRPNRKDGRVVEICITGGGRAAYDRILPIALAQYRDAVDGLSDDERTRMVETLHRVLDNVRRSPFP
ncbi:MAG: MarR family winged helix-turn-helix transcriptional regulator [Hyphomicrobiales bacterium]